MDSSQETASRDTQSISPQDQAVISKVNFRLGTNQYPRPVDALAVSFISKQEILALIVVGCGTGGIRRSWTALKSMETCLMNLGNGWLDITERKSSDAKIL